MSRVLLRNAIGGLGLLVAACSDTSGPTLQEGEGLLVLSVTGRAPAAGPALAPETITLGGDVLVLDKVELVLREIELERADDVEDCDVSGAAQSAPARSGDDDDDDDGEHEDDECEEVEVGPLLINLPLGGGTQRRLQVAVAAGTFDEVEFEVHKVDDDDAADRAFLAAHPEFEDISIRVSGTFNGTPFVFTTDLNVEQEADLSPPLVVTEGATAELTLIVDVRSWFLNAGGTQLVDPRTALEGQANENLVKDNIKRSLDAECEDDRDD